MNLLEIKNEKVEWKTLGEVCDIANNLRKPVKSRLRISGNTPYYGANNIQDYVEGYTHDGEYVLIAEDGTSSLEKYSIQWASGKFWANNHVHVVKAKENLMNRFLYYYLKQMNFIPYLNGGNRAKLTKAKMIEIKIAIPSLEIQEKIVKILDTFTAYIKELKKEKVLREKQYEYYKQMLLSLDFLNKKSKELCGEDAKVEKKSLEKIFKTIKTGKLNANKREENGIYPFYTCDEKPYKINSYSFDAEALLISGNGSRVGHINYYKGKFEAYQRTYVLYDVDFNVNIKYVYYYLKNFFKGYINNNIFNGGIPFITLPLLKKFEVSIPPLEVQEYIVNILDKFDTLVNDIKSGIPREIELRETQYEYYREKLLDFKNNCD